MGYFKIDPEIVLESLDSGDKNVFIPLLEEPDEVEAVTDVNIGWMQADYLKIASALGQSVWGDPMNLRDWNVYDIAFEGSCGNLTGFDSGKITYFKTVESVYITRLIEIHPRAGWVRWGDSETYPRPILQKWKSVNLHGSQITAEDALRIANDDAKERFQIENNCSVIVGSPENNDPENWYLHLLGDPDFVQYIVDLETGDYTFQKLNN